MQSALQPQLCDVYLCCGPKEEASGGGGGWCGERCGYTQGRALPTPRSAVSPGIRKQHHDQSRAPAVETSVLLAISVTEQPSAREIHHSLSQLTSPDRAWPKTKSLSQVGITIWRHGCPLQSFFSPASENPARRGTRGSFGTVPTYCEAHQDRSGSFCGEDRLELGTTVTTSPRSTQPVNIACSPVPLLNCTSRLPESRTARSRTARLPDCQVCIHTQPNKHTHAPGGVCRLRLPDARIYGKFGLVRIGSVFLWAVLVSPRSAP